MFQQLPKQYSGHGNLQKLKTCSRVWPKNTTCNARAYFALNNDCFCSRFRCTVCQARCLRIHWMWIESGSQKWIKDQIQGKVRVSFKQWFVTSQLANSVKNFETIFRFERHFRATLRRRKCKSCARLIHCWRNVELLLLPEMIKRRSHPIHQS
jgi:hypothetical protein